MPWPSMLFHRAIIGGVEVIKSLTPGHRCGRPGRHRQHPAAHDAGQRRILARGDVGKRHRDSARLARVGKQRHAPAFAFGPRNSMSFVFVGYEYHSDWRGIDDLEDSGTSTTSIRRQSGMFRSPTTSNSAGTNITARARALRAPIRGISMRTAPSISAPSTPAIPNTPTSTVSKSTTRRIVDPGDAEQLATNTTVTRRAVRAELHGLEGDRAEQAHRRRRSYDLRRRYSRRSQIVLDGRRRRFAVELRFQIHRSEHPSASVQRHEPIPITRRSRRSTAPIRPILRTTRRSSSTIRARTNQDQEVAGALNFTAPLNFGDVTATSNSAAACAIASAASSAPETTA